MNKLIFTLTFLLISTQTIHATGSSYTQEEISRHDTTEDCWMVFEENVYDITDYIADHDRFLDIREWCGRDMTDDFKDKAGRDRDHRESSYELLAEYKIGKLDKNSNSESTSSVSDPYSFYILFFGSIIAYTSTWVLTKIKRNGKSLIEKRNFHFFWNTVMFVLLIPALGFGIILSARYSIPLLQDISFNWIYWHAVGSIIFGTIAFLHLLNRFQEYLRPTKYFFRKKETNQE